MSTPSPRVLPDGREAARRRSVCSTADICIWGRGCGRFCNPSTFQSLKRLSGGLILLPTLLTNEFDRRAITTFFHLGKGGLRGPDPRIAEPLSGETRLPLGSPFPSG